ncbi:MAG: hypothetical protein ABFS19_02295 [Thermodesulfobacteriota bacterium]
MKSLPKLIVATFVLIGILLGLLLLTALRQNNLTNRYSSAIGESEQIIFRYTLLRDKTVEGILLGDASLLKNSGEDFTGFHHRYNEMLENSLIPSHYKLTLLEKIDLSKLIQQLEKLANDTGNKELAAEIIDRLRLISDQFLRFDRVVVAELKGEVIQFQKVAMGLMGLLIVVITAVLLLLYRRAFIPLIILRRNAARSENSNDALTAPQGSCEEIIELVEIINSSPDKVPENEERRAAIELREHRVSTMINEVTNLQNGIINYGQLLADYCTDQQVGGEQKEILQRIISSGEKSAAILQKELHRNE